MNHDSFCVVANRLGTHLYPRMNYLHALKRFYSNGCLMAT